MIEIANALKMLGDDTRLRIMRLLSREPLNVSEITSILGLAQSGISRHLSLLRKAKLVEEKKEGVWTYYQMTRFETTGEGEPELSQVWGFVRERLTGATDPFSDLPRLSEVLRTRENYGGGLNEKLLEPGQSWFAWSRALHFLMPPLKAIDLGCGDGAITVEIARFAKKVVGIDMNPHAIEAANKRKEKEKFPHVNFREEAMEKLSDPSETYDLALFSQSLHHVENPAEGMGQACRVLKKGARLVVFDLALHQEHWVKEKLGHFHLGFDPPALEAMMSKAGLKEIQWELVHQRRGEVFQVLLATGVKK